MFLFLKILFAEFIAEMGDKTQLMLVAMTSKYKMRDIVLGTAGAILILNGMAVLVGGVVGGLIPEWLIKIIAALAFMYFAITSLGSDDDEEEMSDKTIRFAPVAVAFTFFVAELGDKTQLTAITFGANEGMSKALIVWSACSIGLFAADMLGMIAGYLLKSKIPEGFLGVLAFIIFAIFGVFTFRQGLVLKLGDTLETLIISIIVIVVFVLICIYDYWKKNTIIKNK